MSSPGCLRLPWLPGDAGAFILEEFVKPILKWIGIFLAAVILAVVSAPFLINVNQFRPTLESELSAALGREVKLGNLQLKLQRGAIDADPTLDPLCPAASGGIVFEWRCSRLGC